MLLRIGGWITVGSGQLFQLNFVAVATYVEP